MISSQELLNRIQKNVGVPWQSQRGDGFSDGILFGSADETVTGIVTTYIPTLDVLRRSVASGKNTVICRETPFYSRGERAPVLWRNGRVPSKQLTDNDGVCRAKREFISQNKMVIIRLFDNWDARKTDGQLRGLVRALDWDQFHEAAKTCEAAYEPGDEVFLLPETSLASLARSITKKLKIGGTRVIGDPDSKVRRAVLAHGLLLVADVERILAERGVDVVVAGDAVEWEATPYFQDLVTAKMAKGLILIGEEASEEPGSGQVAEWLKGFVSEVPIEWIPAGEPFWTLT